MPASKPGSADQPRATVSSDKATKTEGDNDRPRESTPRESRTWYKGGTWRRGSKATPVTQVAKESIFAATDKASELASPSRNPIMQGIVAPKRAPSTYLCRSIESPSKSSSLDPSTKKKPEGSASPVTSHGSVQESAVSTDVPAQDKNMNTQPQDLREKPPSETHTDSEPPDTAKSKEPGSQIPRPTNDTALWRGWFSRYEEPPEPVPEPLKPLDPIIEPTNGHAENTVQRRNSNPELASTGSSQEPVPRSWLGLWSATRSVKANPTDAPASTSTASINRPQSSSGLDMPRVDGEASKPEIQSNSTAKSPGWAFWSREVTKGSGGDANDPNIGELALAGSPSQSHPESALMDEAPGVLGKRPRSVEPSRKAGTPQFQRQKTQKEPVPEPGGKTKPKRSLETEPQAKNSTKNLLLPQIINTYRPEEKPSLLQSLSRLWQYNRLGGSGRVEFLDSPPRIKRALTIGVHGYFPAPLIRSVLGQPTGTSIRFADGAANAIHKWTEAQGYSCEIEKVALEGEGKILERVNVLWKLLLNWTDNIRRADFIMVACHSQGVPVAIMLIAKLIEFGCIQDARIGICAMAGVNLGPFVDYKSRWIGGSARELFEFAQPDSEVSKDYNAALERILKSGVKIAYVGSIDDQLVSLDSSTFGTIDHPNIYRAVFVDGRVHAPDFCSLTHLVGFALKLRNLGVSDHGLIRELSSPLAGSLYSGEGHSRIYEDEAVYYLGVQNALQTTTAQPVPLKKLREPMSSSQNPYILPFSLRGILEEEYVKTELHKETMELLKQFDEWRPSTKVLKDVKFRLEGVRSKL
ncbi:MAG: hypothetical protein Q9166_000520 [cf. Caloplaca sp. 2 TL-2023]